MVNRVILIGNLGRDPEVRRLENGAVVAKFPVATNESYRDKNGEWQTLTEWHDVVAWRTLAERAESQLKKGSLVCVEGKLTHRTWQDQDGNNRYSTEVVANYFRAISSRRDGPGESEGYFPSADDEKYTPPRQQSGTNEGPATEEVTPDPAEDDLPF